MIILITGSRKGIGRYLAQYYLDQGHIVIGCSRNESDLVHENYHHYTADVADEASIRMLIGNVRQSFEYIDVLINNAGIASMNHFLLTPADTCRNILETNFMGTFIMCREFARIMRKSKSPRIINFSTVARALNLEGEAIYASSKAAVETFTRVIAKELASYGITVNAIGPSPVKTDLIKNVPGDKLDELLNRQAIKRFGEYRDISNVIDFFISPSSDFITGQIIYLGGVF